MPPPPLLSGDKAKWYSHQLEAVRFTVWSDVGSLGAAVRAASASHTESVPTDESGSDSDGAPSSSSSYSSLSDFVSEMQLSDLSPGKGRDTGPAAALDRLLHRTAALQRSNLI